MTDSHYILYGVVPYLLLQPGLQLADRRKVQRILFSWFLALCILGLHAQMGQAGVSAIDQVQVSIYSPVPQHAVGAQPEMLLFILDQQFHGPAAQAIGETLKRDQLLQEDQIKELVSVVSTRGGDPKPRLAALHLLINKTDASGLLSTLQVFGSLIVQYQTADSDSDRECFALPPIVAGFLEKDAKQVALRLDDQKPLLILYVKLLESRRLCDPNVAQMCARQISDNPDDLSVRQEYMLRAINRQPWVGPMPAFFELLNQHVAEPLRILAFAGPSDMQGLNVTAVELLVELGDQETAERLRGYYLAQGKPEEISKPGGLIARIKASLDANTLLQHIRSEETSGAASYMRWWSLGRAARLGVDPSLIREAVLEYAAQSDTNSRLARYHLASIKEKAQELGVLQADDLPNILRGALFV